MRATCGLNKNKLKLSDSSTKGTSRASKPKAKVRFLCSTDEGVKLSSRTGKALTTKSILRSSRTQKTVAPSKTRAGFSFRTISSEAKEVKKVAGNSEQKKAPLLFAAVQPFKVDFSVDGLVKKSSSSGAKGGPANGKAAAFQAKTIGLPPLGLRGSENPPPTKKRRTAEVSQQRGSGLSSTKERGGLQVSNMKAGMPRPLLDKPQKPKKGGLLLQLNDSLLKKRALLADQATKAGPSPKRSRALDQAGVISATKAISRPEQNLEQSFAMGKNEFDAGNASLLGSGAENSSTRCGDGDSGDECAVKLVCRLDGDKEEEYLDRVATVQAFAEKMAIERKQIRCRLVDAHADISESLLDAFTGLLAEEGGIGIDTLDVNMDIDIDGYELAALEAIGMLQ